MQFLSKKAKKPLDGDYRDLSPPRDHILIVDATGSRFGTDAPGAPDSHPIFYLYLLPNMTNIDFAMETRIQFRRMCRRFSENAVNAFWAGIGMYCYSRTVFPEAALVKNLLEKFAEEVALPNTKLMIFAMLSFCVCLVFNGWPVAEAIKRYISRPYLNFFFDLCGLATGATLAVVLTSDTPATLDAALTIVVYILALFTMAAILWTGIYLLGERFAKLSKTRLPGFARHLPALAGAFMLAYYYVRFAF